MKTFLFVMSCMAIAIIPLIRSEERLTVQAATFKAIETFQGNQLLQYPLSGIENQFYAEFPGTALFHHVAGKKGEAVFLRFIEKPSRKLHAAETCYRANGTKIESTDHITATVPELSDSAIVWSQFRVPSEKQTFLIRQCVISQSTGRSYADVPAWYWQTTFTSTDPGPWLAVTWKLLE